MKPSKRPTTRLLAVVLGLALVAGACGDDDDPEVAEDTTTTLQEFAAGTTMARIRDAGTVKVGVKTDQPGFGLKNPTTGAVEGFDVEIAKLIIAAIDPAVKIEFVETISANRETYLEQGTDDMVVATYTINDARKARVDFAGPYFVARQDIMVKTADTTIKSVEDLDGKRVCTVTGSTSEKNLKAKAPGAKVTLFGKYSECAAELGAGRVDAVTTDNTILAGLAKDSAGAYKLIENPFSDEPYGIGVKLGDDAFRDFINDQLEEMFENGDWADAFEATLGASLGLKTPEPPDVDRYESGTAPVVTTTTAKP